jgi:hypothetical protein
MVMIEAETIRRILSQDLHAQFRIDSPGEYDPAFHEHPTWFVMCPDLQYLKQTEHARAAWVNRDGDLSIGSHLVTDSPTLIESLYQSRVPRLPVLDYSSLSQAEFESEIGKTLPKMLIKLRTFEHITSSVSSKYKARIELKRSGEKDIFFLTLVARVNSNDLESKPLQVLVENNLKALKEAYEEIVAL